MNTLFPCLNLGCAAPCGGGTVGSVYSFALSDLQNSSTEQTTTTMAQDCAQIGCSREVNTKTHSHNKQGGITPQKACNKHEHCLMVATTFNQDDNRLIYPITGHGTKLIVWVTHYVIIVLDSSLARITCLLGTIFG